MIKRLCGREQEFGVRIVSSPSSIKKWKRIALKLDARAAIICKIIKFVPDIVPAVSFQMGKTDYWLCNGSRIYLDMNSVEISTAEHLAGSLDGIAQEKAAELILNKAAESIMRSKIGLESITLYKNNVWLQKEKGYFREETYGSHHNYSYLTKKREKVFQLMKNFIPAALPLTGNGHVVYLRPGKFDYCLSQRAKHIVLVRHSDTISMRPIINIREESLMDESTGLSRLHLISRDATRCEFQTWLVDGMTHLVLRLAEEGWELSRGLVLKSPLAELHRLNSQFDLNYKLRAVSRTMDVVDYNYIFLRAAEKLKPLSSAETLCLQEWERVLELLKAKAFDKLVGELDWATKWWLLKKKMSKYNFGLDDIRAWKIDMGYHDISTDPEKSWFALLEEEGKIRHLITKEDIQKAILTPPETRAKSRGRFIKRCFKWPSLAKRVRDFSWDSAAIDDKIVYFGEVNNPFSTSTNIGVYRPFWRPGINYTLLQHF